MQLLVEAMVYISTNNSREIFMTVLDPYGKMDNDPSWVPGNPGHTTLETDMLKTWVVEAMDI